MLREAVERSPLNFLAEIEAIAAASSDSCSDDNAAVRTRERDAKMKAAESAWRESVVREVREARIARQNELRALQEHRMGFPKPGLQMSRGERRQAMSVREVEQRERRCTFTY